MLYVMSLLKAVWRGKLHAHRSSTQCGGANYMLAGVTLLAFLSQHSTGGVASMLAQEQLSGVSPWVTLVFCTGILISMCMNCWIRHRLSESQSGRLLALS